MLIGNRNINPVNWACPSIDKRNVLPVPDSAAIEALKDPDCVKRQVEEQGKRFSRWGIDRYILPVWQGTEALVLSGKVLAKKGEDGYAAPSEYCLKDLHSLYEVNMDLLSDPLIRAVIETIPVFADRSLILEAEAPFSILASLMDPMDLFALSEEDNQLLKIILHRIADASASYMKSCIDAGCRIISLADPLGTMDLTGEDYYRRICGESQAYLMKICQPFLDKAIVHICRKMSLSLLTAGLADAEPYRRPVYESKIMLPSEGMGQDSLMYPKDLTDTMDVLRGMAEDPDIHFTGMTCLHSDGFNPEEGVKINLTGL